jgi:AsmA family protein
MNLHAIRSSKIFIVITVIFLLLVFALVFIVLFSEPIIKSLMQHRGSAKLERQLTIEGAFHIDWHWGYTEVHAGKIRLSNAAGYDEPHMMTIDAVDFTFKPLKLLIGNLEFGNITLEKPFLVLEKKSAKDSNWNFPVFSKANIASQVAMADNRHNFPIIQTLELKKGQLIYRDFPKGMNLDLKLDSVNGQGGNDQGGSDQSSYKKASTESVKQFEMFPTKTRF